MPRIMPEPRYFSMPSIDVGAEVRMKRALNCWPWVWSLIHSPDAVTHSPAEMAAACPTTVISSRCPRALIRRTQKPLSSLWKVTRSTRPARTSWVDGSCCGFMSIIVSSASALGTPIPRHIDVTGPDVCAALPGGVGVNNVVFRILPKCACDDGALRPLSKIAKQLNSASIGGPLRIHWLKLEPGAVLQAPPRLAVAISQWLNIGRSAATFQTASYAALSASPARTHWPGGQPHHASQPSRGGTPDRWDSSRWRQTFRATQRSTVS